ncbi:isoleucine--tRNA ligase, mitochondrial [Sitophilus oryzae]|uniref:isoleucine--tRNA ligase n=1 Tax=Sitophilus oryzae TaxID=7048 RepID=A0A6J2YHL0_SITOR|nr:isoleucine--tRNA ligase, mitochondrial [Sitophilus oryzae]
MLKIYIKINKISKVKYSTKNSFSHTVLLPKTQFPLKLERNKLTDRDEKIEKSEPFNQLYNWQDQHLDNPKFILHDGPPYANGKTHMGHAINKILKDVILRYKVLSKTKVNYIPGWDCHGLPIELKALSNNSKLDALEIRTKARQFADKTIKQQKQSFISWGVMGDWNNHYETKNVNYVKNQLNQFYKLYENNFIYRAIKPIYWSPSSRTALAEAELEYNEKHVSPSAYVRFEINNIPKVPNLNDKRVYAVIWTTTPWTLPSNQAICYNNSLSYCLIKKPDPDDKDLYIIATELFESFSKETNCEYELLGVHSGEMLHEASYFHPIYKEKVCNFLHSDHATSAKGTGLVHTAPAHGPEDFLVAHRNNMTIIDLVNDEGHYSTEAGEHFVNKFVLTEGNDIVLNFLGDNLLHKSTIEHSYPYDWRTKKPVIIKASKQWFLDTERVKHRATELLSDVKIIPEHKSEMYRKVLINQIQKRSYWCISRQRKWGVPIPVFYDKNSGEVLLNQNTFNHITDQLSRHGTDFWWTLPTSDLLPKEYTENGLDYEKGQDILDIWFDSGISWSSVLEEPQIADLYLEGVDQFTGWFQASLLTSVALRDKAPYKAIFVHGFAVDKNGVKMSKSLGNVVDPEEVIRGKKGNNAYGVDTLRWWVACHANQVSLASISDNILTRSKDEVQKIRNTMRFCLGGLNGYEYDGTDEENLLLIDRYMLHLLSEYSEEIKEHVESYNFHRINTSLLPFLTNQISALYFTAIKDRLYCDPEKGSARKSAQYTLLQIFHTITRSVAGIVPYLAEELYAHLPQKSSESYFTSPKYEPSESWKNPELEEAMNLILDIRTEINKTYSNANTLHLDVLVELEDKKYQTLTNLNEKVKLEEQLKDIFQVSHVTIQGGLDDQVGLKVTGYQSKLHSCPRCRLLQSSIENDLCGRCQFVLNELIVNKKFVAS